MDSPWYGISPCNLSAASKSTPTDHGQEKDTRGYCDKFLPAKDYKTSVKLVLNVNFHQEGNQNRHAYQESLHEPLHDVVAGLVCKC